MGGKSANKAAYFDKLKGLLDEYKSIFIVTVDNVSSQQMHEIRQSMRGTGVVLMGKNTMVRKAELCDKFTHAEILPRFVVPSRASSPTSLNTSASFLTSRVCQDLSDVTDTLG